MVALNVFRQDAFSTLELTTFVERLPFVPTGIGDLDVFTDSPIRTTALAVEERTGQLVIVPTSARGSPATERVTEKRKARYFDVPRLRHGDTLYAHELQNIRAFGQQSELMQVQDEVARRLAGPTGLMRNIQYTWELHRLGAIQGLLLDADGSVIYNWFDSFGIIQSPEIGFNLLAVAPKDGSLRITINQQVVRPIVRAAQGAFMPDTKIYGVCGDSFWDALITHNDVLKTYYNWEAAKELRKGTAFEAMEFGGVSWLNYRGSNDLSTVAIPTDKCKFFPDAPGIFQRALSPAESVEWVNTPGKEMYVQPIFDRDRNEWWRMEASSYPLHICVRPEVLYSGRLEG